jgi:hypothetical protein
MSKSEFVYLRAISSQVPRKKTLLTGIVNLSTLINRLIDVAVVFFSNLVHFSELQLGWDAGRVGPCSGLVCNCS